MNFRQRVTNTSVLPVPGPRGNQQWTISINDGFLLCTVERILILRFYALNKLTGRYGHWASFVVAESVHSALHYIRFFPSQFWFSAVAIYSDR